MEVFSSVDIIDHTNRKKYCNSEHTKITYLLRNQLENLIGLYDWWLRTFTCARYFIKSKYLLRIWFHRIYGIYFYCALLSRYLHVVFRGSATFDINKNHGLSDCWVPLAYLQAYKAR